MDAKEFKIEAEGSCIISEEVIAAIASTAALDTVGVTGLAGRTADLHGIIASTAAGRAVRVLNTDDDTILDIYVTISESVRVQDVAVALQKNVKSAVQAMTGKPVTRVNVHIEGMTPEEKKED